MCYNENRCYSPKFRATLCQTITFFEQSLLLLTHSRSNQFTSARKRCLDSNSVFIVLGKDFESHSYRAATATSQAA